jgi:hypothetical protein
MSNPIIQIDNMVREATDEEVEQLKLRGWEPGEQNAPTVEEEEPASASSDSPSSDDPD